MTTTAIHRFEVAHLAGDIDPLAANTLAQAQQAFPGLQTVHARRLFLIETDLTPDEADQLGAELLADPVNQTATQGVADAQGIIVETHYQPGVMDPVAQSTADAIREMFPRLADQPIEVRTGVRYDFVGNDLDPDALKTWAEKHRANPVIQDTLTQPFHPDAFAHGHRYELHLAHVDIRNLSDDELLTLSRDGHLFLDLNEMRAIQAYYQDAGREPTDIELETLAQTWSEHCVHKTLKATVRYTGDVPECPHGERPHHANEDDGVTIHNLLKATVAAATFKLKEQAPHDDWLVSVFDDNAGIVKFDDTHGVCIKVETHNHPSAIEPYGGAATGIGGCIRDIMGTGLMAKPIANTDTFCVAFPENWNDENPLPQGVIHPRRTLEQVVAGVRDYGNRMGIPTVNGGVYFHDDFVANPLVFAGCIGLIPLDKCFGDARPGDRIIALGGATGRDGIHGATFSSDELTDTHADEFAHAVQIGNAITQKKVLDVLIQARDHQQGCLFSAITDCGAGGFSSAVGEMGEKVGADVQLDAAPLKYPGLSYTEIWISEAQERMVLAVPAENCDTLRALCEAEDVTYCDLGQFGLTENEQPALRLTYRGTQVGLLSMPLLHDGIPNPTREAKWSTTPGDRVTPSPAPPATLGTALTKLLAHPNIASKHWVIRQYDHEVQGGSTVKPLVGPEQDGPSDAAVVRPKLDSTKAIAMSCGMAPHLSEKATAAGHATNGDSYQATLHAIDEAMRNAVCVGADPKQVAILDNFCWPKCTDPAQLGSLVRAAWACYDGALAYATPFVSGKDSLSNQFTTEDGKLITIPPTLLVSALAIVDNATRCVTMDAKAAGNALLIVGQTTGQLGGSHLAMGGLTPAHADLSVPTVDLQAGPQTAQAVASIIHAGHVRSAHDCSDGGLLVAAAEMAFAGRVGLELDLDAVPTNTPLDPITTAFAESPSRYLLEVAPDQLDAAIRALQAAGVPFAQVGHFVERQRLTARTARDGQLLDAMLDALRETWLSPLDW